MRSFLRKACLVLALGSLLFFLSCERHHVGELSGEVKPESKAPAEEHDANAVQPSTPNASHTSQTAEPRKSPANFFPDKPKP